MAAPGGIVDMNPFFFCIVVKQGVHFHRTVDNVLADLLGGHGFHFHTGFNSVDICLCHFLGGVIICKMSTLAVRVGAVYPEEVDLTESHVKRHFRSQ